MKDQNIFSSNAMLWATSLSLTFFWILNICKESYLSIKDFLNFYQPVGPLLGLFIFSLLAFTILYLLFRSFQIRDQRISFWVMFISSLLFLLMVFPPIFEPIVDFLH